MRARRASSLAAPLAAILACGGGSGSNGAAPSSCPDAAALWAASDYSSSSVGSISLAGNVDSVAPTVDLGADPSMSVSAGRAFYVARDEDAVFELDGCGVPKQRFSAHLASHPETSDPYAVAVAHDGTLWVPLFLAASVLVLAPDGSVARTIDLSRFDGDGNPDASNIVIVDTPAGEKAFVALDRLNPYPKSVQPSQMLRIDVATGKIEATVALAGRNPFTVTQAGSILWLADPGNFDDATEADAGIERFDTSTSTTALVTPEAKLGGSVAQVAVSGSCGTALVADPTPNVNATSLVTFDASTGAPLVTASRSPLTTAGFDLEGLSWVGGDLLVGDRRRAAGGYPIHVFAGNAACTVMERTNSLFVPMPPVAVCSVP
ncbi:MAG TPA: hypothetical protein VMI75_04945 [Polyangiaceae bacterium]|nr:hypothetical protein [Polyangiaceae bacterium]